VSLNLRLKDLLGPVTRVKKKNKKKYLVVKVKSRRDVALAVRVAQDEIRLIDDEHHPRLVLLRV